MPLYEYRCVKCDHVFDVIQKFSDDPISDCPECDGTVEKLVSGPALQFKGSGFYITDYTKKSTSSAGKHGSSSAEGGKTKADTGGKAGGGDKGGKSPSGSDSSK